MKKFDLIQSILVDFSGIDENGEYYGDCISDKMADIKRIDKSMQD